MSKVLEKELILLPLGEYSLKKYSDSHSTLTLFFQTNLKPITNKYLHFVEVYFIHMPVFWTGKFVVADEEEFTTMYYKAGLPGNPKIQFRTLSLFKADLKTDYIFILGALLQIEII